MEIRVRVPANAYFYLINWMASHGSVIGIGRNRKVGGRRILGTQLVGHHHHLLLVVGLGKSREVNSSHPLVRVVDRDWGKSSVGTSG